MNTDTKDNVVDFTGSTTLDLDPDRVLKNMVGQVTEVLVIGLDHDGELVVAASNSNIAESIYLMEKFKFNVLSGYYETA